MSFTVYDATQYAGKPTAADIEAQFGFRPAVCPYIWAFCRNVGGVAYAAPDLIAPLAIAAENAGQLLIFDFEQPGSQDQLKLAIKAARLAAPGLKIGAYGVGPDTGPACIQATQYSWSLQPWRVSVEALDSLVELVDVLCPSCYLTSDIAVYQQTMALALSIGKQRWAKPILPFVWDMWQNGSVQTPATHDQLWQQFSTVKSIADGMIIWTNPNQPWNPSADFLVTAKQFVSA